MERTTYSWQRTATVIFFSILEPQATEFSEMIVPSWDLLPAWTTIAPDRTTAARKSGFFMGASLNLSIPRCFQCKGAGRRKIGSWLQWSTKGKRGERGFGKRGNVGKRGDRREVSPILKISNHYKQN